MIVIGNYVYSALKLIFCCFFFFKQKTAYEMRISDWSSDVCSSDLLHLAGNPALARRHDAFCRGEQTADGLAACDLQQRVGSPAVRDDRRGARARCGMCSVELGAHAAATERALAVAGHRSEEHTSELQSLMSISYAVFCLKNKKEQIHTTR